MAIILRDDLSGSWRRNAAFRALIRVHPCDVVRLAGPGSRRIRKLSTWQYNALTVVLAVVEVLRHRT